MNMKEQITQIFERIEKKYLLNIMQLENFQKQIMPYMVLDQFGNYSIMNIYYDTDQFDLIRRSLDRPTYKEKLRLRSYGIPNEDSIVFIELKKKYKGVVYKRREEMPLWEAEIFLNQGCFPQKDTQINREIAYFLSYYKPIPKEYIAYDRKAYYGLENPEIRLTFDFNIRYRNEDLSLKDGDYGNLIMDKDSCLMELKVPGAIPIWLCKIMNELGIYPQTFSKYGMVYSKSVESAFCPPVNLKYKSQSFVLEKENTCLHAY